MGIEPTQPAWEAGVLPLNYICIFLRCSYYTAAEWQCQLSGGDFFGEHILFAFEVSYRTAYFRPVRYSKRDVCYLPNMSAVYPGCNFFDILVTQAAITLIKKGVFADCIVAVKNDFRDKGLVVCVDTSNLETIAHCAKREAAFLHWMALKVLYDMPDIFRGTDAEPKAGSAVYYLDMVNVRRNDICSKSFGGAVEYNCTHEQKQQRRDQNNQLLFHSCFSLIGKNVVRHLSAAERKPDFAKWEDRRSCDPCFSQ